MDDEQYTIIKALDCSNGGLHSIGHELVDSGNGARPMGPQICLTCKMKLSQIIAKAVTQALQDFRDGLPTLADDSLGDMQDIGFNAAIDQVTEQLNRKINESQGK